MINIAIAESWQAYQGPNQIKLEIVVSPIRETQNLGKRLELRDCNGTWWEDALGSSNLVTSAI